MHASAISTIPMNARPTTARNGRVVAITCLILTALMLAGWWVASSFDPVSSIKTPNPSKLPWYYLSLGNMVTYYSPQLAGMLPRFLFLIPGVFGIAAAAVAFLGAGIAAIGLRRKDHTS